MDIREQFIKSKKMITGSEIATRVLKNSSWIVSYQIFAMVVGAFVSAIIARYFGPEKYGQYNYALSFTTLFTALSTLGLDTLTVKAIVDKEDEEGTILCTGLVLRAIGGSILTVLSFIIIRIIQPNDRELHLLVLFMSVTMVFKSFEVIEYWIQAYQRAKISSIIRMLSYIVTSGLKIILVFLKGNLIDFALIYMIDAINAGTAFITTYFRKRENKTKWKFDLHYSKNILSQSWYLVVSGLMVTLYMRIDQVMLGSMLPTKAELGVYSAAVQLASMWYFVPTSIITSFSPVIMSRKKNDEIGYLKSVQLLYTIVTWLGIGFGILVSLFSNTVVGILFGHDYIKAASILSVSIWGGTFAMLGSARGTWLICEGLQKYSIIYIGAGAIANLALNYVLIPIWGGYGAAVATLVSQATVAIVAPLFVKRTRISSIMMLKAFKFEGIIKK